MAPLCSGFTRGPAAMARELGGGGGGEKRRDGLAVQARGGDGGEEALSPGMYLSYDMFYRRFMCTTYVRTTYYLRTYYLSIKDVHTYVSHMSHTLYIFFSSRWSSFFRCGRYAVSLLSAFSVEYFKSSPRPSFGGPRRNVSRSFWGSVERGVNAGWCHLQQ